MTVRDAAAELGITERAVRYRLDRGLLKGDKINGWLWQIRRREVERAKADAPKLGRKPRATTPTEG